MAAPRAGQGYLTRDNDTDDQRFRRVHLTEQGHAAARTIRATIADIEAELEHELGAKQFDQLRQLLITLNTTEFVNGFRRRTTHTSARPSPADKIEA